MIMTKTMQPNGKPLWKVCAGDVCREHEQLWQAIVFAHQMSFNNPSEFSAYQIECLDE
jgi:hypothetical protein